MVEERKQKPTDVPAITKSPHFVKLIRYFSFSDSSSSDKKEYFLNRDVAEISTHIKKALSSNFHFSNFKAE